MNHRILAVTLTLGVFPWLTHWPVASQTATTQDRDAWSLQTPWGHPDLQGVWNFTMNTPLERPAEFGERVELTEEEAAIRAQADTQLRFDQDNRTLSYRHFQKQAISMITSPEIHRAVNLETEDEHLQETYGRNKFGWSLLLARRLLETGVNMIQVSLGRNGTWDLHRRAFPLLKDYLLPPMDRAVSAFLEDLSSRGLLDETLVVMGGEFGRTPMVQTPFEALGGTADGRDHHPNAFTMWLAGGGIKPGVSVGKTDDFGFNVVKDEVHVHDLHATILHLLGFDHTKLTYRFQGRDFRLTDVHGKIVRKIVA